MFPHDTYPRLRTTSGLVVETAGVEKAFGCSFAREDEFLSQRVLQPDRVPLLSRRSAVPIIHAAVEFNVEF